MEYHIPDETTKGFLIKILEIMREVPTVIEFTYCFDQADPLLLKLEVTEFDYTLEEFRQMEKYFQLHECCILLFHCVEAAKAFADRGLFFGGYKIDDFVFVLHEGHYVVKVQPVIPKIISFLGGKADYFDGEPIAPELAQGILTEKADIWSLGWIYKMFLVFYKNNDKCLCANTGVEIAPQYISNTLQIHDMQAIHIMSEFLREDWNLRPGYNEVIECFSKIKTKCNDEGYCFVKSALKSSSFDEYLEAAGYQLIKKLGNGSFGEVFLASDKQENLSAFKFIAIDSQLAMNKYSSEALTTTEAASSYVIKLLSVARASIQGANYLVIQLEYAPHGDLRTFLHKFGRQLSLEERLSIAARIAIAVSHLHSLGKIHRDIKPDNILVCESCVPKLSDFGSNELLFDGEASSSFSGSFGYLAPEVIRGDKATEKVDVWSFGIMFHEIVFGLRADEEMMRSDDPHIQAVLDGCLLEDPMQRLSSSQVAEMLRPYENVSYEGLEEIMQIAMDQEESFDSSIDSMAVMKTFTFSAIISLKV